MGTFKVTGMTCSHCEKVIKAELSRGNPAIKVEVNLIDKTVKVENLSDDRVEFLLQEMGYEAEQVR